MKEDLSLSPSASQGIPAQCCSGQLTCVRAKAFRLQMIISICNCELSLLCLELCKPVSHSLAMYLAKEHR